MEVPGTPFTSTRYIAAFDVDKTLTKRDCVVPFLLQISSWRTIPRFLWLAIPVVWAGIRRDRDQLKSLMTRITMTGLDRHQLEQHGESFARRIIANWLRDDSVQRLQWHLGQGHQVVLVSASYSTYLRHLGSHLGVTDVLSCEVLYDQKERCTGQLLDGNCRGPEKERRLREWIRERGLAGTGIYAYGDSAGDDQLLAMATWSTRVCSQTLAPVPESHNVSGPTSAIATDHIREVNQP